MTVCNFANEISNRNFLSPAGFKFSLAKEPKISFFCTYAKIPSISIPNASQPTYLKEIKVPGDHIQFESLVIKFMIDENMENYTSVHNWMYGIGFPESTKQYKSLITNEDNERDPKRVFSDGTLSILDSDYNENVVIKFTDLFPNYLSSLEFNTQLKDPTNNYLMAEARFEYTLYNIRTANS